MAHIGVKRLGARHGQHHRPQRQEGRQRIGDEEHQRPIGIEGEENARRLDDGDDAQRGDRHEIGEHDRPEQRRHPVGAQPLDPEQPHQDQDRDRQDRRRQVGIIDRDAFHRRQDRHRRRDHRIAVEQRRGEHAQQNDAARPALRLGLTVDQRQQRQAAALALIVGAHDDADIFQRHHQHHRPEHQADDAQYVIGIERQLVMAGEGFAKGVERAGADVAEHDADRAHDQLHRRLLPSMTVAARPLIRGRRGGIRKEISHEGYAEWSCSSGHPLGGVGGKSPLAPANRRALTRLPSSCNANAALHHGRRMVSPASMASIRAILASSSLRTSLSAGARAASGAHRSRAACNCPACASASP